MEPTEAVALAWLVAWLVALSVVDLRRRRLPDPMVATLLAGLVALDSAPTLSGGDPLSLLWACAGAVSYGGLLWIVYLFVPSGLGGGDVKLAVPLGWQIGFVAGTGLATAILTAHLVTCLLALVGQLVGRLLRGGWSATLAFGPSLGAGAVLVLVFA